MKITRLTFYIPELKIGRQDDKRTIKLRTRNYRRTRSLVYLNLDLMGDAW
jgi:hypothetical protein